MAWVPVGKVHAVDQAVEHVGKVQLAINQFVAYTGPAGLLAGDDLDAVFFVKSQHRGHDHAGTVGQGNEADLDFGFFRCVGTCGIYGGAQGRGDADGADSRGLQYRTAVEWEFQKISHGKAPM